MAITEFWLGSSQLNSLAWFLAKKMLQVLLWTFALWPISKKISLPYYNGW